MPSINDEIKRLAKVQNEYEQEPRKNLKTISENSAQISILIESIKTLQEQLNNDRKEFYNRLENEKQHTEQVKKYNKRLTFLLSVLSIVTSVVLAIFLQYLFDMYIR